MQNPDEDREEISVLLGALSERRGEMGEVLYCKLAPGLSYLLKRRLGVDDLAAHARAVYSKIMSAILDGSISNPAELYRSTREVANAWCTQELERRARRGPIVGSSRRAGTPPRLLEREARESKTCRRILRDLSPQHRRALARFYTSDDSPEKICADLVLSMSEFLVVKSAARAAFAREEESTVTHSSRTTEGHVRESSSTGGLADSDSARLPPGNEARRSLAG